MYILTHMILLSSENDIIYDAIQYNYSIKTIYPFDKQLPFFFARNCTEQTIGMLSLVECCMIIIQRYLLLIPKNDFDNIIPVKLDYHFNVLKYQLTFAVPDNEERLTLNKLQHEFSHRRTQRLGPWISNFRTIRPHRRFDESACIAQLMEIFKGANEEDIKLNLRKENSDIVYVFGTMLDNNIRDSNITYL